jgi:putative DNA methylase
MPIGWHSRGYLPHFNGGEIAQTVTFRLAGSLPGDLLERWREELSSKRSEQAARELRERVEAHLDAGVGPAWLGEPAIAEMVEAALLYFDGQRYRLQAWVVMPNHVHALLTPIHPHDLSDIIFSWKSYTAQQGNRLLGRKGKFWSEDYFDRFIRDERHYWTALSYIATNPVKAGLCSRPEEWPWGSARLGARVP